MATQPQLRVVTASENVPANDGFRPLNTIGGLVREVHVYSQRDFHLAISAARCDAETKGRPVFGSKEPLDLGRAYNANTVRQALRSEPSDGETPEVSELRGRLREMVQERTDIYFDYDYLGAYGREL